MSRPRSAVLRLETIETRLCPATGLNPNLPFLTVIQNEAGSAEAAKLVAQVQAGQQAVQSLLASQTPTGTSPLQTVIIDYQLVQQIASNGILNGIETQVSVTAHNYINNPTAANANSLNLALESAAYAFGALNELAAEYNNDVANDMSEIAALAPNLGAAVAANVHSVSAAAQFIANSIQQLSIGSAADAFATPVIPGQLLNVNGSFQNSTITGTISGSGSGTFDPDNDGDDDTGVAGY